MSRFSRRDFLKVTTNVIFTIASLFGLGGLIRFLSYQFDQTPPTEFDIGQVTDYPDRSRTILANIPAVVIHDQNGLRLKGPASRPLKKLRVEETREGTLRVYTI